MTGYLWGLVFPFLISCIVTLAGICALHWLGLVRLPSDVENGAPPTENTGTEHIRPVTIERVDLDHQAPASEPRPGGEETFQEDGFEDEAFSPADEARFSRFMESEDPAAELDCIGDFVELGA